MVRGTFAHIRLRNALANGLEGGVTRHMPSGELMSIFEAATRYADEGVPLVVVAGREYGAGSSRDWAAKGAALLGVRAVIAQSFERIHRQNLVCMGVLPLQFPAGVTRETLALDGTETFDIPDLARSAVPRGEVRLAIRRAGGRTDTVPLRCRIETASEREVWAAGGMMPFVLHRLENQPIPETA
jgi:aconitate hydratase